MKEILSRLREAEYQARTLTHRRLFYDPKLAECIAEDIRKAREALELMVMVESDIRSALGHKAEEKP